MVSSIVVDCSLSKNSRLSLPGLPFLGFHSAAPSCYLQLSA